MAAGGGALPPLFPPPGGGGGPPRPPGPPGPPPRRLTDLIGSLCDLTSGSGDKGTPIVYIQGYFDNYTTE